MLKFLSLFVATAFITTGCEQKKEAQNQEVTEEKNGFFPVTQYLLGQLKELDSLPVTPLKTISSNGKIDSAWVNRDDIKLFLRPFLTPVIDSQNLSEYFGEKSFLDQTINAFTFSYDPIKELPDSLELKHWDIYVDPNNGKVKRVYIVKQLNTSPSQTLQFTWKQDHYCKISTITETGGTPQIKEEQLTWNFDE